MTVQGGIGYGLPSSEIKEREVLDSRIKDSEVALHSCENKSYLPEKKRKLVWAIADLADHFYQRGMHVEALALYSKANKIDCDEPSVLNQMGVCLIKQNKIERALYYFDILYRRADNEEDRALALFNMAICHKLSGNYNEAIILLRKSLRCSEDASTVVELDSLKEMTSRQAFNTFRHNLFSKNVLHETKKSTVSEQADNTNAYSRR